jgi:Flp pilus assembly CpaF family ATPase
MGWRDDPTVVDILVRPWGISIDRLGAGLEETGIIPEPGHIQMVLRAVQSIAGGSVSASDPTVEADLPGDGARFAGLFAGSRSFYTIRCHRAVEPTLADYENKGGKQKGIVRAFRGVIQERKSILVCGPTGTGKTSLLRATIHEAGLLHRKRHFVVIEDTPELSLGFAAPHRTFMATTSSLTMRDLSRNAMRHRPDFLVYGEVRGAEALDVRNFGISGHTTYCTIHAYGAAGALTRFSSCVSENPGVTSDPDRIVEAIQVVATTGRAIERGEDGVSRDVFTIKELVAVHGYAAGRWQLQDLSEAA